jgi:zinc/manganese transport system substrate-binding protein
MVKIYLLFFSCVLFLTSNSQAKINVFACEPEWKSLVEEIGEDKVKAYSATSAFQDPHYIKAKPSLLSKIRRADLLICSGASLESGWLPILLQNASIEVQQGNVGNLMASNYVETLEKPEVLDRALGDIHPEGNPHIHLNPYNILKISEVLLEKLKQIDSENSDFYQANYDNFTTKWNSSIKGWEAKADKIEGINVIQFHKSFTYFYNWLGLKQIATLEVRPGIAPTVKHLEKLIALTETSDVSYVNLSPYDPVDSSEWLHDKSGVKVITLPYTIGGNKESKDLFSLYENMLNQLISNL